MRVVVVRVVVVSSEERGGLPAFLWARKNHFHQKQNVFSCAIIIIASVTLVGLVPGVPMLGPRGGRRHDGILAEECKIHSALERDVDTGGKGHRQRGPVAAVP